MPKPKSSRKKIPWRQDPKKVEELVVRALRNTEKSMKEIAERTGIRYGRVVWINIRRDARNIEETDRIRRRAITKTKQEKRKKACFFDPKQKEALLKEHSKGIAYIARTWWHTKGFRSLLRREFVSLENFTAEIKAYVFEQLDYFDPKLKSKRTGKPVKPLTWMLNGARLFCKASIGRVYRREKQEKGVEPLVVVQRRKQRELNRAIERIPPPARFFLRALGVDLNNVARTGFEGLKEGIVKITRAKETGLTKREKTVVRARLEGQTLEGVGERMEGLTKERIRQIERDALKKIKARIQLLK